MVCNEYKKVQESCLVCGVYMIRNKFDADDEVAFSLVLCCRWVVGALDGSDLGATSASVT